MMKRASITHIFATNLKRIRKERGLSQEKFAEVCGFDRTYIVGLENEYRNPSLRAVDQMALALDILPEEFFKI